MDKPSKSNLGISSKSKTAIKKQSKPTTLNPLVLISCGDVERCKSHLKKGNKKKTVLVFDDPKKYAEELKNLPKIEQVSCTGQHPEPKKEIQLVQNVPEERILKPMRGLDPGDTLIFRAAVEYVIGLHYFDLKSRLKLMWDSDCVIDPLDCLNNHSHKEYFEKEKIPQMYSFIFPDVDQIEELPNAPDYLFNSINVDQLDFVKHMQMVVFNEQFPGDNIIRMILDIMLVMLNPKTRFRDSNAGEVVSEYVLTFLDIVKKFPPCVRYFKKTYETVFCGIPTIDRRFRPSKYDELGLVRFLIHEINKGISLPPDPKDDQDKKNDILMSDDEEDDCINYHKWEVAQEKKMFNYDRFTRIQKFKRLFTVLKLITIVCEQELAIFMLRHSRLPSKRIRDCEFKPIWATILWLSDREIGTVTQFIRDMMTCFVDMIYLDYPEEDIAILAQLLHMTAICVELSEQRFDENACVVVFPPNELYSEKFCKEFKFVLDETNPTRDVKKYINVLKNVKTPFVKKFLANDFINRSSNFKDEKSEGKKFYNILKNKSFWENLKSKPEASTSENVSKTLYASKPKQQQQQQTDQLPIWEPSKNEFITITYICFEAYIDMYRINEFAQFYKTKSNEHRKLMVETGNFFDAQTMDFESAGDDVPECEACKKNVLVYDREPVKNFFGGINVPSDLCMFYREELKLYYYIAQKVQSEYQTCPSAFHDWYQLTQPLFS